MGRTIILPIKSKLSSEETKEFENIRSNALTSDQIRWLSKDAILNLSFMSDFIGNLTDRLKGVEENLHTDYIKIMCKDFDGMKEYVDRVYKAFGFFKNHISDNKKSPA